jgi:hypothetical protein
MGIVTLAGLDSNEMTLIVVAIAVCGAITLFSILVNLAQSMHRTRQVEQSRREIAAYIAEGSMSAEDGEKLLRAEPGKPGDKASGWAGVWNWEGWGRGKL